VSLNIRVNQSLDNGHLSLLEPLLGVTSGGVGDPYGVADLDVVSEGDVLDFDTNFRGETRSAMPI
jgi:hypothetical protein